MQLNDRGGEDRSHGSVILKGLHLATAWLYGLVLDSAIGRYLTRTDLSRDTHGGPLTRLFHGRRKRSERATFRLRHRFAATLEGSVFGQLLGAVERSLLQSSLNTYGIFLLFFGCFSVMTHYISANVAPARTDSVALFTGGLLVLVALPLFASTRSLAYAIRTGIFTRWLLIDALGIAEERFRAYEDKGRDHYAEAFLLALPLGALTLMVQPQRILGVMGLCLLIRVILRVPEAGLVLSVAVCPFLVVAERPTVQLLFLVGLTLASFAVKVLCGKRVFRFEVTDLLVLLMIALYALGGLVTLGGSASRDSGMTYALLMTVYFLAANLVRSQDNVRRLVRALLFGGVAVAVLGLLQYLFATPAVAYLDLTLFSDLGGRVYSTWQNPNMLAEYLVLLLPLLLARSLRSWRPLQGFGYTLLLVLMGGCLILTWSRGAWLGALLSLFLFFICLGHRSLSYTALAALPVAGLLPLLPEHITRRFLSIGNLADSSIRYRLNLWEGVRRMLGDHWLSGIGVGESAFCAVYAGYALPGVTSTPHAHSVYLQMLCQFGVMGLVVFGSLLLCWLRRALEFYRHGRGTEARLLVLGGVSAIGALLIMGIFDEIFYNYRLFFLFWTVMGLVTAQLRIGESRAERSYTPLEDERTQAEAVFIFR